MSWWFFSIIPSSVLSFCGVYINWASHSFEVLKWDVYWSVSCYCLGCPGLSSQVIWPLTSQLSTSCHLGSLAWGIFLDTNTTWEIFLDCFKFYCKTLANTGPYHPPPFSLLGALEVLAGEVSSSSVLPKTSVYLLWPSLALTAQSFPPSYKETCNEKVEANNSDKGEKGSPPLKRSKGC